jgi:phytoene dehydrogenase-like protein
MKKKLENLKEKYDVIIIGSGLAGLTAANKLGKNGYKVLLLEHHFQLGGLATWFKRKDHIFDVSLHGFPVGMIKTCKRYWSKEIANKIVQLKNIRFVNPQFSFFTTFDKEDFTRILVEKFRVKKEVADDFYKTLDEMNYYDKNEMKTRELFNKFFPNRNDIIRMLMEPITYANGSTLDEEAITYGIVFSNFMSKGVFTFEGGTDLFINMLEKELIKNGVDIKTNALVEKIIIEDKEVKGVICNGQRIESKIVLSNANIKSTILDLVGKEHFSDDFIKDTDNTRINSSSTQVYLGIKEGETLDENLGDLIFFSTYPTYDPEKILDKNITSRTFSIYYPKTRPNTNKYSIVSSTNAKYEDWANLSEEEYKKEKEKLIKDTIKIFKENFDPNIEKKIDYVEAATPLTFKRYTRHINGSSFGTKFEGLKISMNLHKEIKGLFHAGSVGIIMSGWLGAANYGVIAGNEIERLLLDMKK